MEHTKKIEVEIEISNLKSERRNLEKRKNLMENHSFEDGLTEEEFEEFNELTEQIKDLDEKIATRERLVRSIVNNRNIQTSQTPLTQSRGELQEIKQTLLRLERKIDQLQEQVNQQGQQQLSAQIQVPPKNFYNYKKK